MRGVGLPLLSAPLLAALLLHGLALALALAGNRPVPRPRALPAPADDTPELLRLSRAAELAATAPSHASASTLPAVPALPPPAGARRPQPRAQAEPRPRSAAPAVRLRQLQAQASALARLWERATPVTGPLPATLAGLPAGVERRRLPAALAPAATAPHGSAVAVPGGVLLVWHGGGSVWLLRAPLQAPLQAPVQAGARGSAAGEGGGAGEQPAQGLGKSGGAEHPVAEPEHDPPGD